jgi:hypothetical protein
MVPRVMCRVAPAVGMALAAWAVPALASAAVLRAADVRVVLAAPRRCDVSLAVTLDDAPATVEHRLEVLDGAAVSLVGIDEATLVGQPRDIGRTRAIVVRPSASPYRVRYTVEQPAAGEFRCPIWLPTIPADGRSRGVRMVVTLPAGARPAGTMPSLAWSGEVGTAALGHLPAFVRMPYAADGVTPSWNVVRLMDLAAMSVLAVASLLWLRRRGPGH